MVAPKADSLLSYIRTGAVGRSTHNLQTPAMGDVLQYEIPQLHPIAVHFPIAFLIAAALVAVPWLVSGDVRWRLTLLVLSGLGAAGAAFAYFTGESMEEAAEGTPIVDELVEQHEDLALYTFILSVVTFAMLAGVQYVGTRRPVQAPRDGGRVRILIGILIIICALLVAATAHFGGVMVWGIAR